MRTKEFLGKHGVPFLSRNVLEDKSAWAELEPFGIKMVPVVTRGNAWANGQILRDVARIIGVDLGQQTMLSPAELVRRMDLILEGEHRFFSQLPEDKIRDQVAGRPRTFANLAYHTFNVADAWLEHEILAQPLVANAYARIAPQGQDSKADILAYGAEVRRRFADWWREQGPSTDFDEMADVYYGDQSKHDFLERTTWHTGQHVRQMMMILEMQGLAPDDPLEAQMWVGLPMPEKVWDDEAPVSQIRSS